MGQVKSTINNYFIKVIKINRQTEEMELQLDSERADELIGQSNDAFNETEHNEVPLTQKIGPFMDSIVVSSEAVIKVLKGLNPSKALGPHEVHPRVLKELANELGPVFAHLFQQYG